MNNQYNPNGQNNYYQPGQQYYTPNVPEEPSKSKGILAMVFGILSIYLGFIPGIVLGIIARKKASEILDNFPNCSAAKFAKIGKITGTIGIPVSIATTALAVIYIMIYIVYLVFLAVLMNGMY